MYKFPGVITHISKEQQAGNFRWKDVVVQQENRYQDKTYTTNACFQFGGNKADEIDGLFPGDKVEITFVVSSREYNGRWYTQLKGIGVQVTDTPERSAAKPEPTPSPSASDAIDNEDDPLPF